MDMAVIFPADDYEKAVAENASKLLTHISGKAQTVGVSCTYIHVKDQFAAELRLPRARLRSHRHVIAWPPRLEPVDSWQPGPPRLEPQRDSGAGVPVGATALRGFHKQTGQDQI